MSPEIVNEESHDYGVDIWCLGILLYEMLHGNPPFNAENLTEIKKEFQKKRISVDPKFDKDTIDLIDQLLRYNPEDRITIEQALNHRAIQKNIKHIRRKITQEEYNLLTRYYYMNSGGNQLMTHNSTYARQLKRQSMLTKTSQGSFRSHDSTFFEKMSTKNKSNFFDSVSKRKSDLGPLKLKADPADLVNDFQPEMMDTGEAEGIDMINKLTNSAFKKKPDSENNILGVNPAQNVETKESERFLDFFKKGPGKSNETGVNVQGGIMGEETSVERKTAQDVRYRELSTNSGKAGQKMNNQGKMEPESRVRKTEEIKVENKKKEDVRKINQTPKRNNETVEKRATSRKVGKSKDPKKHTTLREFQKQYNTESLKKKFQNEPKKPIETPPPKRENLNHKKTINEGKMRMMPGQSHSGLRLKNNPFNSQETRSGNQKKEYEQAKKKVIKNPSMGTVYLTHTAQTVNTQQKPAIGSGEMGPTRQMKNVGKKKDPSSIFTNLYSKAAPVKTETKPVSTFKSVTHAPNRNPVQVREYKSNNQPQKTQSVRIQNDPRHKMVSISPQRTNRRREPSQEPREKPITNLISEHTSIDQFGREVRTRHTQTVFRTFDEVLDTQARFSEGVHRSRTVDRKESQNEARNQEKYSEQQMKHLPRPDNKKKLSQIFEESSPVKKNVQQNKNVSLFNHLKKKPAQNQNMSTKTDQKFLNLTNVDQVRKDIPRQAPDNRSKSNDMAIERADLGSEGKFNRRVVYVNGIKTAKMIFSKSNNNSDLKKKNRGDQTKNEKGATVADPRKESQPREEEKPNTGNAEETDQKDSLEKTEEAEKKKKYKIITVPQTKARVIQEGGLKFSNVKPITIIQQGNFALSSSRNKNAGANLSMKKVEKEESTRAVQKPKMNEQKQETVTVKMENENKETTITQKKVISYKEYKRRLQETQSQKNKQPSENKSDQHKPKPKDQVSKDENVNPKFGGHFRSLSRGRSVDVHRKHTHKPTVNPNNFTLPRGASKTTHLPGKATPFLNEQLNSLGNVVRTQSGPNSEFGKNRDDMNSLMKKLDKMNQVQANAAKNKTTGSISLTRLIKDTKKDSKPKGRVVENSNRFQQNNMTQTFRNQNNIFSHKKNKTMQHLTHENIHLTQINQEKPTQKYVTATSRNLSLTRKVQNPKHLTTNEFYSQSMNRNYEPKNEGSNQVWNVNNAPTNRRPTPDPKTSFQPVNSTRVNHTLPVPQLVTNSYKSSSKRQVEMDFQNRYSYGRRGWQAIISSRGNLKQSNSMSKLRNNGNGNGNSKSSSVYRNKKTNFTAQTSPVNYKMGNVTTTIRRYMVHPSPSVGKYRFESQTQGQNGKNPLGNNRNMVNGNYKNQIFTNLKELKKNLKTNYYNQK